MLLTAYTQSGSDCKVVRYEIIDSKGIKRSRQNVHVWRLPRLKGAWQSMRESGIFHYQRMQCGHGDARSATLRRERYILNHLYILVGVYAVDSIIPSLILPIQHCYNRTKLRIQIAP